MKIYLASLNSGMAKKIRETTYRECKPKYALESFYAGEKLCKATLDLVGNNHFLLDSGAFSYMSGAKVNKEIMEKYVNRYIAFIKKYEIKRYFEIDVDNIFGLQQVEIWRNQIEAETKTKCIPVWHKGRGVEYFKKMCTQYSYIAIGGLVFHIKKQEYELIRKLVNYACKKGVKVHGLGFTKINELNKFKFYSVDSASWVRASSFGKLKYTFSNGIIHPEKIETNGKRLDLSKLASHNFKEWCKFQRYMEDKA